MNNLIIILGASFAVSVVSLVGIFFFFGRKNADENLFLIVPFSAGAMLASAFFNLLPEAIEEYGFSEGILQMTVLGIVVFFVIEKFIHWHHHHKEIHLHPMTYLNLVGDAIHNFVDGITIAVSFMVSFPVGVATTIAIIAHEVPQELGDFGLLVYGGFSKRRALFANFITALFAVGGAIMGYFLSFSMHGLEPLLLGFAAGSFIYIASADIVPEMHKEKDLKKSFVQIILFLLGIGLILGIKLVFGSH